MKPVYQIKIRRVSRMKHLKTEAAKKLIVMKNAINN